MITDRHAIRGIVLTPEREILLLRILPPDGGDGFWVAPGGGLEPGESAEAGLRRELGEELGLERFDLGPLVWRRQHTFNWAGRRIRQREDFYIVPIHRFEPRMLDPVEAKVLDRFQWWPLAELARISETVAPRSLASIVQGYLEVGAPLEPPAIEILAD